MERDYVVVVMSEKGEIFHVKGLKNALIKFRDVVKNNIDSDVDLHRLQENWTDLDADNVDEFIMYHESDAENLYVAEFCNEDGSIGVFAVEHLSHINNIDVSLNVYEFEGTSEDFYSGEWVSFLGDLILSK